MCCLLIYNEAIPQNEKNESRNTQEKSHELS
jgi:hypothetical protein